MANVCNQCYEKLGGERDWLQIKRNPLAGTVFYHEGSSGYDSGLRIRGTIGGDFCSLGCIIKYAQAVEQKKR